MIESINKKNKIEGGLEAPITIPGLAQHLVWTVDEFMNYPADGKFARIIDFAKVQCENYLLDAVIQGKINKNIGEMLLKTYFGYKDKNEKKKLAQEYRRSISRVLDEIESENKKTGKHG